MKIRQGMKVRISKNLNTAGNYGTQAVVEPMLEYSGKYAVITRVLSPFPEFSINLDEGRWVWNEAMIEVVSTLSPFVEWENLMAVEPM